MKGVKKIRAFTLSEMLVVLLLTVIVVGLAFSVLNLVQRQMSGIESNYARNTAFDQLKQSLWVDFHQHEDAWYTPKNNVLLFENEMKSVTYELHKDYVVKQQDTFQLEIADIKLWLHGHERTAGEMDALELTLSKAHGKQQLFVFKKNASNTYINR
ncbi:MAG: hypothetical protein AAF969_17430 [Bacteroidota bacterium]